MNNIKELIKNMGFLTLGNLSTKLISFLLVPLYTNILTTTEYGIFDLINNTITILVPFFTLNICDSVFRFTMDKNADDDAIVSYSIKLYLKGLFLVACLAAGNYFLNIVPIFKDYCIFFLGLYVVSAYNTIVTNYARGKNRILDISLSGVVSSVTIILLNIFMLVIIKCGITGYFIANIFGILVQCIYLTISTKMISHFKFLTKNNYSLKKKMLTYSKPLIINSVAWWINSVSDRYIVIWFCGIAVNGIYSIAYKIPSIINIFQTIFGQAWTLFAIKEVESKSNSENFDKIYRIYNTCIILVCATLIALNKQIAKLLYAKDFYQAWIYVPFLLISSLFSALSAFTGGIFAAEKESKIVMYSTLTGAVINIGFNIALTPILGAVGATIATAVSYYAVWIVRIHKIRNMIPFYYNKIKYNISYIIIIIQACTYYINKGIIFFTISQVICLCILTFIYIQEICNILDRTKNIINRGT